MNSELKKMRIDDTFLVFKKGEDHHISIVMSPFRV